MRWRRDSKGLAVATDEWEIVTAYLSYRYEEGVQVRGPSDEVGAGELQGRES